jgi:hypothetical protein
LNAQSVRKHQVQTLIYHIEGRQKPHIAGVPETMTNFFTNMYKQMQ